MKNITIALSKGRILEDTLPLLKKVGIQLVDNPKKTRKLILDTNQPHIKVLVLRATDVPTFVAQGAADIGVAGKDVLIEHEVENVYELVDLKIAKCKLMVAGHAGKTLDLSGHRRATVATKYVKSAQRFFANKGRQVEIIKLYGSMELAPLVGMADYIVDVVDTGNTLKANNLEPFEHIVDISSRLIANKAAMKIKHAALSPLVKQLEEVVA